MNFDIKNIMKNIKSKYLTKQNAKSALLPVSAFLIFSVTIIHCNATNYGITLECNGQSIATVSNEEVYEKANKMIVKQSTQNNEKQTKPTVTQIKIAPVKHKNCCEDPDEVKNKIIENSQNTIVEAYGVYSGENLIAVAKTEEEIRVVFEKIITKYSAYTPEAEVKINSDVTVRAGLFAPENIKCAEELEKSLTATTDKIESYIVQEGDTLSGVAEKLGVKIENITCATDIAGENLIAGDVLHVLTQEPVISACAIVEEIDEKVIPFVTTKEEDGTQNKAYQKITQQGKNGSEIYKYQVEYVNGKAAKRTEISREIIKEPICCKMIVGTASSDKFIWPVPYTKEVSSPFGRRGKGTHTGIDIASHGIAGKDIIAVADGVVESVQTLPDGYGKNIVVAHKNGRKTRYAHCQNIYVKSGEKVTQGQKVASVGRTGHSTGDHLHFEVIENGKCVNPINYFK